MTTLQKPDGSLMSDLNETVKIIIDYLIHKDEQSDDTDYHKRFWAHSKDPILITDERDYTPAEVKNVIDDLHHKKSARGRRHHKRHIPESL